MASVPIKDRKFDTQVQYLKYKVLREVARYAFEDRLLDAYTEIPKLIVKEKPAAASTKSAPLWRSASSWPWAAIRTTPTSSK